LRDRGGESAVSKQAAFFLGRIFDEQNRSSLALRWLETYLAESPSGVYASEALGRQLTLIKRTRGTNAARRKAHEYLKRFPEGTYARTARALVGSD
jgi:TolA-binding protein